MRDTRTETQRLTDEAIEALNTLLGHCEHRANVDGVSELDEYQFTNWQEAVQCMIDELEEIHTHERFNS